MPDLGKYAGTVLGAYGVSIAVIVALVLLTLWQGARVRRALEAQERRAAGGQVQGQMQGQGMGGNG